MHFNKYILLCIFYLLNLVPLFGHKQIEALKTFCAILAREYLKKKKRQNIVKVVIFKFKFLITPCHAYTIVKEPSISKLAMMTETKRLPLLSSPVKKSVCLTFL